MGGYRSPPVLASPARNPGVEAQVRALRRSAEGFSRGIDRLLGLRTEDPAANARGNLAISRAVFGKWSLDILVALYSLRSMGSQQLRSHLSGVTPRVLSAKLKALEGLGLVRRTVLPTRPPRVSYRLTTDGRTVARLGEPVILFLRYLTRPRG